MENKINQIVKDVITELMFGGSSVNDAYGPRGGPYGVGAKKQLAAPLDPSVQAIEDQTQAELDQDIDRQAWSNHKFPAGKSAVSMDERNASDASAGPFLPGTPDHNAIEAPVQHVPDENMVRYDDNGMIWSQDGTEEYVIDDIIDELEKSGDPRRPVQKESTITPVRGFPNQAQAVFPGDWTEPDDENEMGHLNEPSAIKSPVGGYGAILQPKQFVPDEAPQESDLVDTDGDGIDDKIDMDQPPELRQRVKEAKRSKHKSTRSKERYGAKPPSGAQVSKKFKDAKRAIMELGVMLGDGAHGEITGLMHTLGDMEQYSAVTSEMTEDAVDEEYKSRAQQGYFHAKAAEGDSEFKKLANEFDDDTTAAEFKNLPARAPKREALNSEGIKRLVKEEILRQIKEKKKKKK